jgi:hypothetical protein
MPKQRHATEEIIHKLREADVLIGQVPQWLIERIARDHPDYLRRANL